MCTFKVSIAIATNEALNIPQIATINHCPRLYNNYPSLTVSLTHCLISVRILLDSVNRLLTSISTNQRPGQKECDKAISRMESMRPILDNPIHPISHEDYYDCLDFIIDRTMASVLLETTHRFSL